MELDLSRLWDCLVWVLKQRLKSSRIREVIRIEYNLTQFSTNGEYERRASFALSSCSWPLQIKEESTESKLKMNSQKEEEKLKLAGKRAAEEELVILLIGLEIASCHSAEYQTAEPLLRLLTRFQSNLVDLLPSLWLWSFGREIASSLENLKQIKGKLGLLFDALEWIECQLKFDGIYDHLWNISARRVPAVTPPWEGLLFVS